ncbi:MAG: alpha/beta hydrolase family protein [Eubacteriales bacterium]|nr:alpha/beta hydrolase family protein [Eubacteriales bacterium]MDD3867562.1 alpha/beta hydrolase family protein [Eubacteriales bacterium]MDD4460853.1 alpha/beta hydrolase family protein [Eubacteriales bacterium]
MAHLTCNFLSYTLRRAVDLTIIFPTMNFSEMMADQPSHQIKAPYPVLYLLHGYANNHATWNGYTRIELFAEERNIAVVMLSAENKAYINHGGDDNYFDFISHELPEFVKTLLPISDRPDDTFIAGLSMGGYGSLVHGLSQSERFAAIGSFSGAPGKKNQNKRPEAFDCYHLAERCAAEDRRVPMYISCGDQDELFENNVAFKNHLLALDFDVTWVVGENYLHEWRFWDREVEAFLDWIPRSDPHHIKDGHRRI